MYSVFLSLLELSKEELAQMNLFAMEMFNKCNNCVKAGEKHENMEWLVHTLVSATVIITWSVTEDTGKTFFFKYKGRFNFLWK